MNSNKQIISIEGNIGTGKSTFVSILKHSIENSDVVPEPIDEWKQIVDSDGTNILEKFYSNVTRWSYTFQNIACITRMMKIENAINNSEAQFLFLDRSLATDKNIFEKMLYDEKQISDLEHNAYNLWVDFYHKYIRPEFNNIVIYLRCKPETSYLRIKKRAREEEISITLDYLRKLHEYHENWLISNPNINCIVVDCDEDFESDINYQCQVIDRVVDGINTIIKNKFNLKDITCKKINL